MKPKDILIGLSGGSLAAVITFLPFAFYEATLFFPIWEDKTRFACAVFMTVFFIVGLIIGVAHEDVFKKHNQ